MPKYRSDLPQLQDKLFITDGGLETTLIFHYGIDLPEFAAFDLINSSEGQAALRRYAASYADVARQHGVGFVLESPTWRSSPDWGAKLGYSPDSLDAVNRKAIELLQASRADWETPETPIVISACVGPRGDGYDPGMLMTPREAEEYHAHQIGVFADTEADMVTALTITNVEEGIGIANAAKAADIPVVISFTVETDGALPTGQSLREAIEQADAATGSAPAYYMVNCAHPTHFASVLSGSEWARRIRGIRANASTLSHAELDEATELDDGDPAQLASEYLDMVTANPWLRVLGGCCGTDHRHVEQIVKCALGKG